MKNRNDNNSSPNLLEPLRFAAMDIGRLVAALIVFFGHMLFLFAPNSYGFFDQIGFIEIFKYGALSVIFFFYT